jgi:hypothetical protein
MPQFEVLVSVHQCQRAYIEAESEEDAIELAYDAVYGEEPERVEWDVYDFDVLVVDTNPVTERTSVF